VEGLLSLTADPASTAKLPAVPSPTADVAASGRAAASKDGPANESDITRITEIANDFNLFILDSPPAKNSKQRGTRHAQSPRHRYSASKWSISELFSLVNILLRGGVKAGGCAARKPLHTSRPFPQGEMPLPSLPALLARESGTVVE
jgi:hypothetical protein